jgi:hypothetical protein
MLSQPTFLVLDRVQKKVHHFFPGVAPPPFAWCGGCAGDWWAPVGFVVDVFVFRMFLGN